MSDDSDESDDELPQAVIAQLEKMTDDAVQRIYNKYHRLKHTQDCPDLKASDKKQNCISERQRVLLERSLVMSRSEIKMLDDAILAKCRQLDILERHIETENHGYDEFVKLFEQRAAKNRPFLNKERKSKKAEGAVIKKLSKDVGTFKRERSDAAHLNKICRRTREILVRLALQDRQKTEQKTSEAQAPDGENKECEGLPESRDEEERLSEKDDQDKNLSPDDGDQNQDASEKIDQESSLKGEEADQAKKDDQDEQVEKSPDTEDQGQGTVGQENPPEDQSKNQTENEAEDKDLPDQVDEGKNESEGDNQGDQIHEKDHPDHPEKKSSETLDQDENRIDTDDQGKDPSEKDDQDKNLSPNDGDQNQDASENNDQENSLKGEEADQAKKDDQDEQVEESPDTEDQGQGTVGQENPPEDQSKNQTENEAEDKDLPDQVDEGKNESEGDIQGDQIHEKDHPDHPDKKSSETVDQDENRVDTDDQGKKPSEKDDQGKKPSEKDDFGTAAGEKDDQVPEEEEDDDEEDEDEEEEEEEEEEQPQVDECQSEPEMDDQDEQDSTFPGVHAVTLLLFPQRVLTVYERLQPYMSDSQKLVDLLEELNEQNLFLVKGWMDEKTDKLDQTVMAEEFHMLRSKVVEYLDSFDSFKEASALSPLDKAMTPQEQDAVLETLGQNVTEVYQSCVASQEEANSVLEKLSVMEERILSVLQQIEERRRIHEENMQREKEKQQREKAKKSLHRSMSAPPKKLGKKPMIKYKRAAPKMAAIQEVSAEGKPKN